MCELCRQHGEGKIWYLNIKNYLEERLSEEQKLSTRGQHENVEHAAAEFWNTANAADNPDEVVRLMFEGMKEKEWGQVVPLEDVEKIFDMSLNIVRSPCVCRVALRGAREYRSCFKIVASPSKFWSQMFDSWPDLSEDMDVVSLEEAKKDFLKFDEDGLVHTVWTYGSPFIGALCNCTPMDCLGMKGMAYGGHRPFFKAEYVAVVDAERCIGCRECMSFCHFNALRYSSTSEKCSVNQLQCFGCGLCRKVCTQDAIRLDDRNKIPGLMNQW